MPLADGTQTQDEAAIVFRHSGLVGVPDDARVEQGRRFERVFVEKICANQATLRLVQFGVRRQGVFHILGTRLENIDQIPVATLEIVEHIT
jgi:hypothetical protein